MNCRICGETKNVNFHNGSRMFLCGHCRKDMPTKQSFATFLRITGLSDDSTGREFWEDYRYSKFGSVKKYWAACSENNIGAGNMETLIGDPYEETFNDA